MAIYTLIGGLFSLWFSWSEALPHHHKNGLRGSTGGLVFAFLVFVAIWPLALLLVIGNKIANGVEVEP